MIRQNAFRSALAKDIRRYIALESLSSGHWDVASRASQLFCSGWTSFSLGLASFLRI